MTRLYFHAASSSVGGTLPSTEQSTLTATRNADAETVNRSMDTTIGTSEISLSTSPSGDQTHYFTKFVSPLLDQTSVSANTWTYAFAAEEGDTSNNFPVDGNNNPVHVNCYVWKPSDGTKVGTILDGNTAATVDEGTADQQRWHIVTFSGSAVSSITAGDAVIVFEVWFVCEPSASIGGQNIFYFDGTDDTTAENGTTTSAASFIETPETLTFEQESQTFQRTPSDTITLSETLDRLSTFQRTASDTPSLSETLETHAVRLRTAIDTTILTDDVQRTLEAVRTLSDNTISDDTLQRIATFIRIAQDNTTVNDTVQKFKTFVHQLNDTTNLSENIERIYTALRIASDNVVSSDNLVRIKTALRTLQDTIGIAEDIDVTKLTGLITRQIQDTVNISENVQRIYIALRTAGPDTANVSEQISRIKTAVRTLEDTTALSENLQRILTALRTLSDTTNVSENVQRIYSALRTLLDTTGLSDSVQAIKQGAGVFTRQIQDTVNISDNMQRLASFTRNVQDTLTSSDQVQRSRIVPRILQDIVTVGPDSLTRLFTSIKHVSEAVSISEFLQTHVPGTIIIPALRPLINRKKVKGSERKVKGSERPIKGSKKKVYWE